jgi:hypothetical protein
MHAVKERTLLWNISRSQRRAARRGIDRFESLTVPVAVNRVDRI